MAAPGAVGANATAWWMTAPGPSCWPSAIGVGTAKGAVGGAALVIVSTRFPVLLTSKDLVSDSPTGTCPKSRLVGLIVRCGVPVTAVPVSGMLTARPSVPVTVSWEASPPAGLGAVGA